ncbi:MAG: hypothetical protein AVDCRST_MAG89-3334, partial [uncultured Gemmatimonadetes bacterium]
DAPPFRWTLDRAVDGGVRLGGAAGEAVRGGRGASRTGHAHDGARRRRRAVVRGGGGVVGRRAEPAVPARGREPGAAVGGPAQPALRRRAARPQGRRAGACVADAGVHWRFGPREAAGECALPLPARGGSRRAGAASAAGVRLRRAAGPRLGGGGRRRRARRGFAGRVRRAGVRASCGRRRAALDGAPLGL